MKVDNAVAEDGRFVVELDQFQGPLDLLLHLIRSQDIDIFDIPMSRITAQFLRAIEGVEALGLDTAGEFLETAATLVRIKVQMLLPKRVDELGEAEDPRTELVRRLLEYEHFRDAARRLGELEADRYRHFARGHVPPLPRSEAPAKLEVTWDEVLAAAAVLKERLPPVPPRIHRRVVAMEEKIALIIDALTRWARIEFSRLVAPFRSRPHAVATFLAGLELARQRRVSLRQREPFAPIWLYRYRKKREDETDADR